MLFLSCNRDSTISYVQYFSVQAVLKHVLEKFLPDDVHTRSNGRVRGENKSSFPSCSTQTMVYYAY